MAIGIQNLMKYMERRTQNMESPVARAVASKGIRGDTEVGHLERGDIVVPPSMQTPGLVGLLSQKARQQGYDLSERVVGSPRAERNPSTGAQMFADPKEDFLPPSDIDWGLPWIEQYEGGYNPYAERYDWMEDVPPILHWSNFVYNPYNNEVDLSRYGEVGAGQGGGEHVWWGLDPDAPVKEKPIEEAPVQDSSPFTFEDVARMMGAKTWDDPSVSVRAVYNQGTGELAPSYFSDIKPFSVNLSDKWTGSKDQRYLLDILSKAHSLGE